MLFQLNRKYIYKPIKIKEMKKVLLVLVAVIASSMFLVSCEDEDEINEKNICGKWNVTQINANGSWSNVESGVMYAKFNTDNTYESKDHSYHYSGTWRLEGEVVKCNVSGVYVTYTILDFNSKSGTFEVKEPGYYAYNIKAVKE